MQRNKITRYNFSWLLSLIIFAYLLAIYFFPIHIKKSSIAFIVLFLVIVILDNRRIIVSHQTGAWLIYISIGLSISVWNHNHISDVLEFCASLGIGLIIFCVSTSSNEHKYHIGSIFAISIISAFGCVLQLLAPDFLISFNSWHLDGEKFRVFYDFFRENYLVGFSYQTGCTGFYLSILVGFCACYLLFVQSNKSKRIFCTIGVVVSLIMIFFTGKRIFILLSVAIICLFLYLFYRKHFFKMFLCLIGLAALFVLLLSTDAGRHIIERTLGAGWTTGRNNLSKELLKSFVEKPILGNGFGSTISNANLNAYNGHNIYLQILSETGIFGFFCLIPIFIHDLANTFKLLFKYKNLEGNKFMVSFVLYVQLIFIGWGFTGNPLYDVYPLVVYMIVSGISQQMFFRSISSKERAVEEY